LFPLTLVSDYPILDVNDKYPYSRRLFIFRRSLLALALLVGGIGISSQSNADSISVAPPAPTKIGILAPAVTAGEIDASVAENLVNEKLADPRLGANVTAYVIDANSGKVLVDIDSEKPMIPASTLKIFTGIAAMNVLGAQTRFETVVKRDGNQLTIIGGGDPTLVSQTPENWRGKPPGSEQPPSLDQLADLAVTAIGQSTESFVVNFDDSLFAKPEAHETWPDLYIRTGEVAPAQGLIMDFGINDSDAALKDPAKSTAQYFTDALTTRGVSATLGERKLASEAATVLTSIKSATVTDIVERMITTSNNTMAEFLAHHVGGAKGEYTYDSGARATTEELKSAQVDLTGVTILDGSGLSRSNRASAKSLVSALNYANTSNGPAWSNLSGLPIAGISGTLIDRYEEGEPGRGTVRAKTGTLSKVVALSGTLVDASGDLLIFTFIANEVPSGTSQGASALDEVVMALAQCGCRTP
jgi:D-alanyl-D-alanine carboxypeptidase/D-alanyl-D-alanine-endopeptidase (penicillin-binding protein 4)